MNHDSVPAGDLARLLDTERRFAERLRSVRAEAESVIARARAEGERLEAALAAELEADQRRMVERLTRERRKREREIAAEAEHQVSVYVGVSAQRLDAVAHALGRRLLDDASSP
jgi:vacuolar-type H+-ATPase subunit H